MSREKEVERHGPSAWEGEARRHGPVSRVAVLSDVHANVPALRAVLDEPDVRSADLVVFCGDLTWGVNPDATVGLVRALGERALCVRGNGERFALAIADGAHTPTSPREAWVPARHSAASLAFIRAFAFSVIVEIDGLGAVRFCHGSPRSDNELVTPGTPEERFRELTAQISEPILVTGHTHLQFDRTVADRRSVNPGSVGLPYHLGEPGTAYWALLGPDVQLRQTRYEVEQEIDECRRAEDPRSEAVIGLLTRPPSPQEIIANAEGLVFSD